jgi:hypothetical protein
MKHLLTFLLCFLLSVAHGQQVSDYITYRDNQHTSYIHTPIRLTATPLRLILHYRNRTAIIGLVQTEKSGDTVNGRVTFRAYSTRVSSTFRVMYSYSKGKLESVGVGDDFTYIIIMLKDVDRRYAKYKKYIFAKPTLL